MVLEAHFVGSVVMLRIAGTCLWDLAPGQIAGVFPGVVFTLPFSQQEILKRSLVPGDETTNHLQSPTVPTVVFPDLPDPFSAVLSQPLLYSMVVFAYKFSKFFSLSRIMSPFCQGFTLELHSCGFLFIYQTV